MNETTSEIEITNYILNSILKEDHKTLPEFLQEKCDELKISQRQLCAALDIERKSIQRIMDREANKIDVQLLLKLSNFLGLDIKDLLKFYVSGINIDEAKKLDSSKKNGFLINNFDIKTLKQIGFIQDIYDFNQIEERINTFFGFNTVFEYSGFQANVMFSRGNRNIDDKMLQFWLSTVHYQLKQLDNPNVFNREQFLNLIPKLRVCTTDFENGFRNFIKALYNSGVNVIVETYLSNTSIHGGTFFVNHHPCIVLTNYYKKYDRLWFTLAHEIFHIINDLELIKSLGYHLSGATNLFDYELLENQANNFARELLLPNEKYEFIKNFIKIDGIITEYSNKWNVHPSIIYGFYLRDNDKDYNKYSKYIPLAEKTLKNIEINPWQIEKIEQIVEKLNQNLRN